jgi:hypothetical protein
MYHVHVNIYMSVPQSTSESTDRFSLNVMWISCHKMMWMYVFSVYISKNYAQKYITYLYNFHFYMAQDRDQRWVPVNTVMSPEAHEGGSFLTTWVTISF